MRERERERERENVCLFCVPYLMLTPLLLEARYWVTLSRTQAAAATGLAARELSSSLEAATMTSMLVPAMDLITSGLASNSLTLVIWLSCSIFTTMLFGKGLKAIVPQFTPNVVASTTPSSCTTTPKLHINNKVSSPANSRLLLPAMICSCSTTPPPPSNKKNEKQKHPKQQNKLTTPKNHSPTKFLVTAKSSDTRKS